MNTAYGKTPFGRTGSFGQPNGFGCYWEQDMYPAYDFLNEKPTQTEINQLNDRRDYLWTGQSFQFGPVVVNPPSNPNELTLFHNSGVCFDEIQARVFRIVLFRFIIPLGNRDYVHIAALRYPREQIYNPVNSYPVIIHLHGNTLDPINFSNTFNTWAYDNLTANSFYPDSCAILYPLYFGYSFRSPFFKSTSPSAQYIGTYNLPNTFKQNRYDTIPTDSEGFKDRFQKVILPDGFGMTSNEVQILAVLMSIKALRYLDEAAALYDFDHDLILQDNIGLLGSSMGANMLYDVAPILHRATGVNLKVAIALYGGTDQYAPFNVRRSKRFLASQLSVKEEGEWTTKFTYDDILLNQKRRTTADIVLEYLDENTDQETKATLRRELRYWMLEDSVAKVWNYASGPYPLQIHHGTDDTTVYVENSRWLREQMRYNGVQDSSNFFQYFETPFVGHNAGDLNSLDEMAALLQSSFT